MTFRTRGRARDESGETLLEILFTVMILGIASTAIVGAMAVTVVASDAQRRVSDSEVVTRDFGEIAKNLFLHPASTTLTADIPSNGHVRNDSFNISVASTAVFPTAVSGNAGTAFGIQIDTEEFTVTQTVNATTLKVTSGGSEGHKANANVTRYDPCPTVAQLQAQLTPLFTVPAGSKIGAPLVTAVTFYSGSNPPTDVTATCANYWNSATQVCNPSTGLDDHLTECDPPVVKITFSVTSTDNPNVNSQKPRFTTTSSQVLFRRGNT